MALKTEGSLLRCHAASVVNNLNEGTAAVVYYNNNGGCTGIYGILHKLLDNIARALDNLTGCNKICNMAGQYL